MNDSLRVLQVMGSSSGGVVRHVAEISSILTEASHKVVIAGPQSVFPIVDQVMANSAEPAKRRALAITDRPRATDFAVLDELRRIGSHADVIHAHGLRAGALTVLAMRVLRRASKPKIVVTLHNLPVGSFAIRAVSRVLETIVGGGADVVLGVSGDLVDLAEHHGAEDCERALVPAPGRPLAGQSRDAMRLQLDVPEDTALIVTVARLAPQKGLHYLLDAAATLSAGHRFIWVIAGDGPLERELADRIEAERLPVALLGRRDDVSDLMAAADVVANTSVWEGQPLVLQEALALGAPIVATDVGGTSEVSGTAASLVDAELGPDAFAWALGELLADAELRGDMSRSALARAAELPCRDDVLEQLLRVYVPNPEQR